MSQHKKDHLLTNDVYDGAKWVAQILLPALGTLYFALAGIWDFPAAEQVVGSIVALDAFLGVLLGISTASYNRSEAKYDGEMEVEESEDGVKTFNLNLKGDPYDLPSQDEVRFKVKKGDS